MFGVVNIGTIVEADIGWDFESFADEGSEWFSRIDEIEPEFFDFSSENLFKFLKGSGIEGERVKGLMVFLSRVYDFLDADLFDNVEFFKEFEFGGFKKMFSFSRESLLRSGFVVVGMFGIEEKRHW